MSHHLATQCVHAGSHTDVPTQGTVAPIQTSTAYGYLHSDDRQYPRYFNTANQQRVATKVATLEGAAEGILFGSGMAAISSALFAFLEPGDHVLMQTGLYGGTTSLAEDDLKRLGIEVSYTAGLSILDFESGFRQNTKVVYLETPSNPLLNLVDVEAVAGLARKHGAVSMIDNTFASPINQTPHRLGIDIVLHSATKYLGGHSDITAGIAVGSEAHMKEVLAKARHFGGSCEAQTAALLERSIKTLALRVRQQNANAQAMAEWLEARVEIARVNYPGLASHPQHELAKRQMHGFGGMLSFELVEGFDPVAFQQNLKLVASAMSLGGVDTSVCSAYLTSHRTISAERRAAEGISDQLIRMSMGIEDVRDLQEDVAQALKK
ncbi:MAG: PLP-dependent aspartate aminotransferase family protein [Saprospiraceae bacterium]